MAAGSRREADAASCRSLSGCRPLINGDAGREQSLHDAAPFAAIEGGGKGRREFRPSDVVDTDADAVHLAPFLRVGIEPLIVSGTKWLHFRMDSSTS